MPLPVDQTPEAETVLHLDDLVHSHLSQKDHQDSVVSLDNLSSKLQTLETINERLRFELRQSGDSSDSAGYASSRESSSGSSRSSIHVNAKGGPDTPPELTTSPCGTPSDVGVLTPSTIPNDGSKHSSYFSSRTSIGKHHIARISSPLATDGTTTPRSESSDSIREDQLHAQTAGVQNVEKIHSHTASTERVENEAGIPPPPEASERSTVKTWLETTSPPKELVLPTPPKPVHPRDRTPQHPDDEIDVLESAAEIEPEAIAAVKPLEKQLDEKSSPAQSHDSDVSVWSKTKASYIATYCPTETPPLILPTAPTDNEKTMYLKTNRLGLYTFGVFSFLSLSAGMWLFVISNPIFYWFGAFVALLQVYLLISYAVSICGKDYDIDEHNRILAENPIDQVTAPTVDIYLPCCKEPIEVLENTYKHVQQLKWPEGKLKVYVLDDGASDAVQAMASQYGYNYICREDRPRLKKAGNLRWAFARTEGDFFAIFDADFCPRPDFLHEIMPIHLAKRDTAIVQTPQFFRVSDDQTWVEQGAGAVQELFYRIVQINRNRFGASICVGSNAVYRREALIETGGTAEIGFSEDVHTGFYAVNRGWAVRYLPLCLACGICPDTPRAFFSQQMRWCMGSTTLLTNMDFWRSNLNPVQKICYLSGMMYYSAISLSIFISPLPGILMLWCRPEYVKYYNLAFAIPSLFYSIIAMRAWSKASYGFNVQHVMVIQSYAYLTAIKDRLFGRALAWVPSGDTKAHKNNKYRNMRILAICWEIIIMGLLISGVIYQTLRHTLHAYDCVPLICLMLLNLYLSHRFLFWHGKI